MRPLLHQIDLPTRRVDAADQDEALLGAYRAAFLIIGVSGAFGLLMTAVEPTLNRRARAASVAATGAVFVAGLYGAARPRGLVRLVRDRRAPTAIAGFAMVTMAASSPPKTPMCFPSALLMAVASVPLASRTSRRFGGAVGAAYLLAVGWSARNRLGRDRQLAWNVGMSLGFPVAANIGAAVGRLSIDIRLLERARQRDRRLIDQPDRAAHELQHLGAAARTIAAELDRVLLGAAQRDYGDATSAVRESIEQARSPTHHLELAPVLIAAARGEPLRLVGEVTSMLDTYRSRPLAAPCVLTFESDVLAGTTFDARTTAALLVCIKRALDNVVLHAHPTRNVAVRLAEIAGQLRLQIEDDGGGEPPPVATWGTGLSEARRRCVEVGGDLLVERGVSGVRLTARVLANPPPLTTSPDERGRSIAARTDAGLLASMRDLKLCNAAMGVAGLWCADDRRRAAIASAVLVLVAADDLHPNGVGSRKSWIPAALAASLWPMGARPATGWLGVYLIDRAVARAGVPWAPLATTMAALCLRARRVRSSVAVGQVRGDLVFPPLCVFFSLVVIRALNRLAEIERNTVSLRQRAEYIESLVPAVQTFHDIVSPLKSSGAWLEHLDAPTRAHLQQLSDRFTTPTAALREGITVPDPVADLQEHLAVRLSPIAITVSGSQPRLTETREHARLLDRARHFTGLIALADDITDRLLDDHPPDALSRHRLVRVHLHIEPSGEDDVMLSVQPVLTKQRATRREGHVESAASTRESEALSAAVQSHRVATDALARRGD